MNCRTALLLVLTLVSSTLAAENQRWVVTWGASPSPQMEEAALQKAKLTFENQTLRQIVHTSIGGDTVRVRLSNAFNKEPVLIGSSHIAVRSKAGDIMPGTDHILTFSGRSSITIPANGLVASDPVKLSIEPVSDVAVSLFLPQATKAGGIHYSAQQANYISGGDMTGAASVATDNKIESWVFLADLDVMGPKGSATLVTFGDSITDGARSTVDANHRWPNFLTERLQATKAGKKLGVLDAGIGGNRVLHDAVGNIRFGINALARFDSDVLAQPGAKYVVVMEGINDLGHAGTSAPASETVSAEDLIAGLRQLAERSHENGLKIFGATLTAFTGAGYFTPEKETKRQAINQWIRTGGVFDGVIDFDKATQDPQHPEKLLPAYDSGDHLHPNDAGYKAMGESVNLSLFK